ncbi:MAG: hypothetical protein D6712_00920, partial [Chloroflexi bacterium]
MFRGKAIVLLSLLFLLGGAATLAQNEDDICPIIVQEALEATDAACQDTGRNEACYGNISIDAEPREDVADFTFEQQGDKVAVTAIDALTLSPFDAETEAWGVALLRLQANLPDTLPGQNVTFLLFGDVELVNEGDAMEAFLFRSGIGDAPCEAAPDSGILVNTPEGVGEVTFTVNQIQVTLGSIAFIQAEAGEDFTIGMLEGHGAIEAEGETVTFETGELVRVPLDEDLMPAGPPSEPEPFDTGVLGEFGMDAAHTLVGEEVGVPSEPITPLSGEWTFIPGAFAMGEGCPPAMQQALSTMSEDTAVIDFSDGVSMEVIVTAADAPLPPNAIFANPDVNVYTMYLEEEGATLLYTLYAQSETLLTGTMEFLIEIPGMSSCTYT